MWTSSAPPQVRMNVPLFQGFSASALWHRGLNYPLLCTVGCLATSLLFTHQMPITPSLPLLWQRNMSPDIAKWMGKSLQLRNMALYWNRLKSREDLELWMELGKMQWWTVQLKSMSFVSLPKWPLRVNSPQIIFFQKNRTSFSLKSF